MYTQYRSTMVFTVAIVILGLLLAAVDGRYPCTQVSASPHHGRQVPLYDCTFVPSGLLLGKQTNSIPKVPDASYASSFCRCDLDASQLPHKLHRTTACA